MTTDIPTQLLHSIITCPPTLRTNEDKRALRTHIDFLLKQGGNLDALLEIPTSWPNQSAPLQKLLMEEGYITPDRILHMVAQIMYHYPLDNLSLDLAVSALARGADITQISSHDASFICHSLASYALELGPRLEPNSILAITSNCLQSNADIHTLLQALPEKHRIALTEQLLQEAHNESPNHFVIFPGISLETARAFLDKGMDASIFLSNLVDHYQQDPDALESMLMLAQERNLFGTLDRFPDHGMTIHFLEKFLAHGLDTTRALALTLDYNYYRLSPGTRLLVERGANLYHPDIISRVLLSNHSELLEFFLEHDCHICHHSEYVNAVMAQGNIKLIRQFFAHGADASMVTMESYIAAVGGANTVPKIAELMRILPNVFDEHTYAAHAAFNGVSPQTIRTFIDLHRITKDWLACTEGTSCKLNPIEMAILDSTLYPQDSMTNAYGYTPLHLAILSGNKSLTNLLIGQGNLQTASIKGTTPLEMLTYNNRGQLQNILLSALGHLDAKSFAILEESFVTDHNGYNPLDAMISNPEYTESILRYTKDPLFLLLKPHPILPLLSSDKIHIGISHSNGYWSTGAWSMARKAMRAHPDIELHLLTPEILEQYGEALFRQLDGVINPGGGDTYPTHMSHFTAQDCGFASEIEKLYQKVLALADIYSTPYIGMCAGAQHLALHHDSTLGPLGQRGQVEITFSPGTLSYFQMLTPTQQKQALQQCNLPPIKFAGDVAHRYGAYPDLLGQDLQLGAISTKNVAMAYSSSNGLQYGTQFHPEHYYDGQNKSNREASHLYNQNPGYVHQNAWFDNFFHLARLFHRYHSEENAVDPTVYMHHISARLQECMIAPTCMADPGELLAAVYTDPTSPWH